MSNNDGGPAFPNVPDGAGEKWDDWDKGMSLRDYFAAKAMLAFATSWPAEEQVKAMLVASMSYEIADAMLEARAK